MFRKAWGLDKIVNWEAPEVSADTHSVKMHLDNLTQILEKYCGYGFLSDHDGNPILMSLLGNTDVEGAQCRKGSLTCLIGPIIPNQCFLYHCFLGIAMDSLFLWLLPPPHSLLHFYPQSTKTLMEKRMVGEGNDGMLLERSDVWA